MFACCRSTGAVDETANAAAAAASRNFTAGAAAAAEEIIFKSSNGGSKADATSTTAAEEDPLQVTEAVAVGCMRPGNSFLGRRTYSTGNSSYSSSSNNRDRERTDSNILRIIDEIEAQAALDEADAFYRNSSNVPSDENNGDAPDDNTNTNSNDESSSLEVQVEDEAAMNPFMRYVLNLPESENVAFVQSPKASPSVQSLRRTNHQQDKDDEDLNDNRDEGRNPPLYKPPKRGVQAKRMWLQQAFSPTGAERFPDSPTKQSPSPQTSQRDNGKEACSTPVNAKAVVAGGRGGGGLVLPSPAPTTYMASGPAPLSPQKPQPVTAGYKNCSASPNDETSYEAWYQKGLLRWRPSKFQPRDAAGSYQHMRSIANLGGSQSDILQDPLVISPISGTSSNNSTSESPDSAENQNQNNDEATSKATATDKSLPPPLSIPEDPAGGYQHQDSIRVIPVAAAAAAAGEPLQITTNTVLDSHTTRRRRPDPPITSLFSPQKPATATKTTTTTTSSSSSAENGNNTDSSSSYVTPRSSRTVPIVSLFGSPTTPAISANTNQNNSLAVSTEASLTKRADYPQHLRASQLSPFEKVEYYATFVDSYKGYVGDRTSPEAKSMLRTASQELEQIQAAASAATAAAAAASTTAAEF